MSTIIYEAIKKQKEVAKIDVKCLTDWLLSLQSVRDDEDTVSVSNDEESTLRGSLTVAVVPILFVLHNFFLDVDAVFLVLNWTKYIYVTRVALYLYFFEKAKQNKIFNFTLSSKVKLTHFILLGKIKLENNIFHR